MSETLEERQIEAAFRARAAGAASPELEDRISAAVRSTRQQRPLLFPGIVVPAAWRLGWVAVLAAATLAVAGSLALIAGWRPPLLSLAPVATPSPAVLPSPSSPIPSSTTAPTSAPTTGPTPLASRSFQARFTDDEGVAVTIEIVDESGRLVDAVKGEAVPGEPTNADVIVANPPGQPTELRVDWFSPAGCHEHYSMTIHAGVRRVTIHTAYVEGGDSIGGNCGVTLRFSDAVAASTVEGVLVNTPPVFGVGSLTVSQVARVVATDGLRVRSAAGLAESSARLEPLLPEGVRLRVLEGPVTADGYAWYRVSPCGGQPAYPTGWVAVASRLGEHWVDSDPGAACPTP